MGQQRIGFRVNSNQIAEFGSDKTFIHCVIHKRNEVIKKTVRV